VKQSEYIFDEEKASKVVNFIGNLKYLDSDDGQVKRFELDDWKRTTVEKLFGTVKPNGKLWYRRAYISIAKKNRKSSLATAMLLYAIYGLGKKNIENYSAADAKNQAAIIYDMAVNFIEHTPALTRRTKLNATKKRITNTESNGFYESLSSDGDTKHGFGPFMTVVDEIHVHKSKNLYDALKRGSTGKEESLFLVITHAGKGSKHFSREIYDHAKKVQDGSIEDNRYYVCLYELEDGDDWTDKNNWVKPNPSLLSGQKPWDGILDGFTEAQVSTAEQITFKQMELNMWVDSTEGVWINDADWMACEKVFSPESLYGQTALSGYDGAEVSDFCALVLFFSRNKEAFTVFLDHAREVERAGTTRSFRSTHMEKTRILEGATRSCDRS
jgi:phage terminase large subunit-like protein